MSVKAVFLIFFVCAAVDFVFGYVKAGSFPAGVISVVLGLFGTAFYLWCFGAPRNDDHDSHRNG